MSVRASRWWLFLIIVLTVPLPMLGPYDAFVPPVRHLILSSATASIMAVEGAAGPVPAIFLLFAIHALVYLALAWGVAWLLSRLSGSLSPQARGRLVLAICAGLFFLGVAFDLYVTPFGRAPTGNLWSVLS